MQITFFRLGEAMRTSLWFLPSQMVFFSAVLAHVMIGTDRYLPWDMPLMSVVAYAGEPEGARLLLSSIATSMITVGGTTFSITMVALTLTTSQFGPRLLRNFMTDRINQAVLGMYISTFVYCLLVLRSIRNGPHDIFVPNLAVTVAIILALVSFGLLIYFFHHISTSIHAENVIHAVYRQLVGTIDRLFTSTREGSITVAGKEQTVGLNFEQEGSMVLAGESGYLLAVNQDVLFDFALQHDVVVKTNYRPENFVFAGTPLLWFLPRRNIEPETEGYIRDAFIRGRRQSPDYDVEFSIHQLVEVAVRALSPGINDPYTAISCIDRLGAALCTLNRKFLESPYRYDKEGKLRLILKVVTFEGILDAAFNQIRQYGRGNVDINIRLLEILEAVAFTTDDQLRLKAIGRHGEMVYRSCQEAIPEKDDRRDVEGRYRRLMERLNMGGG